MVDPDDGGPPQSRPPRLSDLVSLCRSLNRESATTPRFGDRIGGRRPAPCRIRRSGRAKRPVLLPGTPRHTSCSLLPANEERRPGLRWESGTNHRDRISIEAGKRGGKPCIRGTRITVHEVLDYLASGMSEQEILDDFPDLTRDDLCACLAFAADRERRLVSFGAS